MAFSVNRPPQFNLQSVFNYFHFINYLFICQPVNNFAIDIDIYLCIIKLDLKTEDFYSQAIKSEYNKV